ncbi:MAG TPA: sugar phosphate nucleotidyltransferase [Gaiellaceae bacterium]|jgi:NDP-sugar pyrophosphorylase family protein|nr:sugar phosphate nucleotidyltransferase [Gaiellaceae bacterium]
MRAVIMAGGRGSRLAPYTTVLPKPLMPLIDRPVIDVVLRQLVRAGVDGVLISVGHLGSLIESWIRSEADYGIPISFLYEDEPLGTAGALANIPAPEGTFLALNGDILTTLSFAELTEFHRDSGAVATMAVKERTVDVEYGVVHTDEDGAVVALEEKPRLPYTVSMGIYAFEPAIVEHIGAGEHIDFPDLLVRAIGAGERVAAYRFNGYWRDIGNRDDYESAIADFGADPSRFVS